MLQRKILTLLACSMLVFSVPAHAFKIKTHIWIGQQVINDLEDDGMLSVELGGEKVNLSVNADTRSAILKNRSAFLLGNMGPDTIPDPVVGQTVVHPGSPDEFGWKTNDWMEHLLQRGAESGEVGRALAYGYVGHAGADVFAHTYINQYAGDIFDLEDEALVEQRHFVLEGYIDNAAPPLTDYRGTPLGPAWSLVTVNDELAEFVRDSLIFDNDAQDEYWGNRYSRHLAELYQHRKNINALAEDPIWREIDIMVAQYIAKKMKYDLSDEEAAMILEAADPILRKLGGPVIDEVQGVANGLYDLAKKYEAMGFQPVADAMANVKSFEDSLLAKKTEYDKKLAQADSYARHMACDFAFDVIDYVDPTGFTSGVTKTVTHFLMDNDPVLRAVFGGGGLNPLDPGNLFGGGGGGSSNPPVYAMSITGDKEMLLGLVNGNPAVQFRQFLSQHGLGGYSVEQALRWPNSYHNPNVTITAFSLNSISGLMQAKKAIVGNYCILGGCSVPYAAQQAMQSDVYWYLVARYNINSLRHPDFIDVFKGMLNSAAQEMQPGDVVTVSLSTDTGGALTSSDSSTGSFCDRINDKVDALHYELLAGVQELDQQAMAEQRKLRTSVADLRDESLSAIQSLHDMVNAIIDLLQTTGQGTSPIKSLLESWRGDVDLAMREYVKATSQVMLNTINHDASVIQPLSDWFECYQLALIGVSHTVSGCQFRSSIDTLTTALDNILTLLKSPFTPPEARWMEAKVEELKEELILRITDELKAEAGERLEEMLPENFRQLLEVFETPVNDAVLIQYFTKGETVMPAKHLLMIPDIVERVKAEMHLQNGVYNPQRYAVIKNGLTMAKLALLDREGMRELAQAAGIDYYFFDGVDNMVASAFENIDANHQWMEAPPPWPNAVGAPYKWPEKSFVTEKGFLPWSAEVRDKVFRTIFIGPLSPGIDDPVSISKSELLQPDYPYDVCDENPYPDDTEDMRCTANHLLTIINDLLD